MMVPIVQPPGWLAAAVGIVVSVLVTGLMITGAGAAGAALWLLVYSFWTKLRRGE